MSKDGRAYLNRLYDAASPELRAEMIAELRTLHEEAKLAHVKPPEWRQTIAVDFDGVIHSYTSEWVNTTTIADPPVSGAIQWLTEMTETFDVVIHSCRTSWNPEESYHEDTPIEDRVSAIRAWLHLHGMACDVRERLRFHTTQGKPHADVYIDDRGFRFDGRFPSAYELQRLVPWNRRETPPPETDAARDGEFICYGILNHVYGKEPEALASLCSPEPPAKWTAILNDVTCPECEEHITASLARYGDQP